MMGSLLMVSRLVDSYYVVVMARQLGADIPGSWSNDHTLFLIHCPSFPHK